MAESANRQDEVNSVLWLAAWAGKMDLSWLLRISCIGPPIKSSFFGKIINPLLTKHVWTIRLYTGLILFCTFIDLNFVLVNKKLKKELGQYPAILTSCLVNNAYLQLFWMINQINSLTEILSNTAVHHLKPAAIILSIYLLTSQYSYVWPPLKCKFLSKQS